MVQPVTIYAEMYDPPRTDLPSISDAVGAELPDKEQVVAYMREAVPAFDVMDVTKDLLGGEATIDGGSSLYTDGTWVWREDSIFYVANRKVVPDAAFLEHVRAQHYRAPSFTLTREFIDQEIKKYF